MPTVLQVNSKYSFDVYPSTIIGSDFKSVTVVGIVTPHIARTYVDLEALHVQVFPYLPAGTPNSATGYDYAIIKTTSGKTTVIGLPWIKSDTIVLVESGTIYVEVGDVTSDDLEKISNALVANGFNNITLKLKTN